MFNRHIQTNVGRHPGFSLYNGKITYSDISLFVLFRLAYSPRVLACGHTAQGFEIARVSSLIIAFLKIYTYKYIFICVDIWYAIQINGDDYDNNKQQQ